MSVVPLAGWRSGTQREGTGLVRRRHYHLTVSEFFLSGCGTKLGCSESSWQPVIPPAPLTGDVGRDCGDASRALLFVFFQSEFWPTRHQKIRRAAKPDNSIPMMRPALTPPAA